MAVIQISKIQQRRGRKLLTGSIPQLSSAELAWAVDTQELFIGNGSVAEGAPYVGNTKVLTEHDNLLELLGGYRFAEDDLTISASVPRSIQNKLDEYVSILDFGPKPDASTDHGPYFTRAFEQLFQATDTNYRKVLVLPNGYYYLGSVLKIPSNVVLKGETRDGVVLDVNSFGIEFLTSNNSNSLNFDSVNHPKNVSVSDLTIQYTVGTTNMTGLKNSKFNNVKWKGTYVLGNTVSTPVLASQSYDLSAIAATGNINITGSGLSTSPLVTVFTSDTVTTVNAIVTALNLDTTFDNNFVASRVAESLVITATSASGLSAADIETYFTIVLTPTSTSSGFSVDPTPTQASTGINNTVSAISWINSLYGTRVTGIEFNNCVWESVALGVKCIHNHGQSDAFDTEINFNECTFYVNDTGIYLEGAGDRQVNDWTFDKCRFEEIARQAVFMTLGSGTVIHNSNFKNVGNGVNGSEYPTSPMVQFGTKYGNVVDGCKFDRPQTAGITLLETTVGVPEVLNGGSVKMLNDYHAEIYTSDTPYQLAVFSSFHRYIIIDYVLTLGEYNYVRKGKLTISNRETAENTNDQVAIADNFTYSPSRITDPGAAMLTNFEFNIELRDNDNSTGDSTQSVDTLLLTYTNPVRFGGTGTVSFSVAYGV